MRGLQSTLFILMVSLFTSACSSDSGGGDSAVSSGGSNPTSFTVYVGLKVDSPSTMARVGKWTLDVSDPSSPTMTFVGYTDVTTEIGEIRTLALGVNDTDLFVGGLTDDTIAVIDTTNSAHFDGNDGNDSITTVSLSGDGSNGLQAVHGLCQLPGGNIVAGEDGWSDQTNKSTFEYSSNGSYANDVGGASTYSRSVMANCVGTSSSTMFWIESDTNDSNPGILYYYTKSGTWGSSDTSTMLAGGLSIALDTENNYVYAFPQSISIGGTGKVWRCATGTSNDELSSCGEFGPVLTSVGAASQEHLHGAALLPGTEKLIYTSTNSGSGNHYFNLLDASGDGSAISIQAIDPDLDGYDIDSSYGIYGVVVVAN